MSPTALRELGLVVPDEPTITDVVAVSHAAIEAAQRRNPQDATDLSEMARHAAGRGPAFRLPERLPELWEAMAEDRGRRSHALRPGQFAEIAQRFFGS